MWQTEQQGGLSARIKILESRIDEQAAELQRVNHCTLYHLLAYVITVVMSCLMQTLSFRSSAWLWNKNSVTYMWLLLDCQIAKQNIFYLCI